MFCKPGTYRLQSRGIVFRFHITAGIKLKRVTFDNRGQLLHYSVAAYYWFFTFSIGGKTVLIITLKHLREVLNSLGMPGINQIRKNCIHDLIIYRQLARTAHEL